MSDPSTTPAGWFPDPLGRHEHRYFNGTTWTADVADDGVRSVDPFGASPVPTAVGAFDGGHDAPTTRNGIATAAMVCGIIGLLLAWVPFVVVIGFVLALLALIFGVRGVRRSTTSGVGRGKAVAGIVMGGVGLALSALGVVLTVVVFGEVDDFLEAGPVSVERVDCTVSGSRATVTGELHNRSSASRDYTLFVTVDGEVSFVTVEGVPADGVADWDTWLRVPSGSETCEPDVDVYGPFPFGLEIQP